MPKKIELSEEGELDVMAAFLLVLSLLTLAIGAIALISGSILLGLSANIAQAGVLIGMVLFLLRLERFKGKAADAAPRKTVV